MNFMSRELNVKIAKLTNNAFSKKKKSILSDWKTPNDDIVIPYFGRLSNYILGNVKGKCVANQLSQNKPSMFGLTLFESIQFKVLQMIESIISIHETEISSEQEFIDFAKKVGIIHRSNELLTSSEFYETKKFNTMFSIDGIEWWFNEMFGLHTCSSISNKQKDPIYCFDYTDLADIEVRKGYSRLGGVIEMKLINGRLMFHRLNGSSTPSKDQIRLALTSSLASMTIKYHALYLHYLTSNNINYHLLKIDIKTSCIKRLLSPITVEPFGVNEIGVFTLLTRGGFPRIFNLSKKGMNAYWTKSSKSFDLRKTLDITKTFPDTRDTTFNVSLFKSSPIQREMCMWWNVISYHCSDFINNSLINEPDETYADIERFLSIIRTNYPNTIIQYHSNLDPMANKQYNIVRNTIEICTMLLFTGVAHETVSNPTMFKSFGNPFIMSSTLRNDDKGLSKEIDGIKWMSVLAATSMPSFLLANNNADVGIDKDEKKLFTKFSNDLFNLDIPKTSILHPSNVESSVRW